MTTQIIDVTWKPPEGRAWWLLHYTQAARLQAVLDALHPPVVYRDAGGSYWIPVES